MRTGSIPDNAVKPGSERRTTLELTKISKGQEKSLLHSVFAVFWMAEHLSRRPLHPRHPGREEIVQLNVTHIHRQRVTLLHFRDYIATSFLPQVTLSVRRYPMRVNYRPQRSIAN